MTGERTGYGNSGRESIPGGRDSIGGIAEGAGKIFEGGAQVLTEALETASSGVSGEYSEDSLPAAGAPVERNEADPRVLGARKQPWYEEGEQTPQSSLESSLPSGVSALTEFQRKGYGGGY